MPTKLNADVLALETGALVELYDLDLSIVLGPVLSFHPHTCGTLVFNGVSYMAAPIMATGFDRTTNGTAPRPKLTVGNINSAVTAYLQSLGDIAGATLTRTRTFAKYLDAATLVAGAATSPDGTQYFPKDIFNIERKSAETEDLVTFDLSMSSDTQGTMAPRRQVTTNSCPWAYRGTECGNANSAAGTIFYDGTLTARTVGVDRAAYAPATTYAANDGVYLLTYGVRRYFISLSAGNVGNTPNISPTFWAADICSKRLTDCKLRLWTNTILPFGGFPGAGRMAQT